MKEIIDRETWQPLKIEFADIPNLMRGAPELRIVDQIRRNLEELFLLRNPKYRFDKNYQPAFEEFIKEFSGSEIDQAGTWFHYPWENQLIHFLPDEMHQELRTGRNRNLITKEEQEKYYRSRITVLGMSVGSHVAATIAMTGGSKNMKLADPDVYSGDNLNRVRSGFQDVGTSKAVVMARKLYEIDPYGSYGIYPEGLNENNVEKILLDSDIVIEEMDNLYWKLKIRELAATRGIPVIMGTDNGDGMIVDIERFDLDRSYPVLHGTIGDLTAEKCKEINPQEFPKIYAKVAGAELAVPRMLQSVVEVGKTLYSWPQLGTAANLCGTVVSYLARRIILKGSNIKSGRYQVNLDSIFESDYSSATEEREKLRNFYLQELS